MRWQTVARLGLAAVGLACAVAIYLYTRGQPAPPLPPLSLPSVDPGATAAASDVRMVINRPDRPPVRITAGTQVSFDDGRRRFHQAVIEGLEEERYVLRAGMLETVVPAGKDQPDRLDFSRGVHLRTDDGLELESETAAYDTVTGLLTMPGRVTFKRGRLSGESLGAVYDRDADAFVLQQEALARVAADAAGRGGAEATAARMRLMRGQKALQMEERARIAGADDTLIGHNATVVFTDDEQAVKYVELRGAARVQPVPRAAGARPAMQADSITMAFHPDGVTLEHATLIGRAALSLSGGGGRAVRASWIDAFVASDGQTLTALTAKDQVVVDVPATGASVGRRVTAASLRATGEAGKGLTQARFEGAPVFEETPASGAAGETSRPVKGSADILVLRLAGRLDAIDAAEFQGRATVRSGDARAVAEVIQYDEANRRLRLLPGSGQSKAASHLETRRAIVDGATIDLALDSDDVVATGSVRTQMTGRRDGPPAKGGSLFAGDEPVMGAAETFRYTDRSGVATYEGSLSAPARLWQGQSELRAVTIDMTDSSRNVTARGAVDSTFWVESKGADASGAPLKRYRVRADTLSYDEARRTAVYDGVLVVLTSEDADVEAPRITVVLAADSRAVQSLAAGGASGVFATFSGGYEAVGERLTYDAATETHTLFGSPARVKEPRRPSPGQPADAGRCLVHIGPEVVVRGSARDVSMPGPGGRVPQSTEEIGCDQSLRPKR